MTVFIDAIDNDAKNIINDTAVKVWKNLFFPVNLRMEKYEAPLIAIQNTNSSNGQNKGIAVVTADIMGTNPSPSKSVYLKYFCILVTCPNEPPH